MITAKEVLTKEIEKMTDVELEEALALVPFIEGKLKQLAKEVTRRDYKKRGNKKR